MTFNLKLIANDFVKLQHHFELISLHIEPNETHFSRMYTPSMSTNQ